MLNNNKHQKNVVFFKKAFGVIVLVLFCTAIGVGQNIRIMGIPLGISYNSFKQQLLSNDFTYNAEKSDVNEFSDTYLFNGKFAGENVGLSVYVTPKSKIVYSVGIRFKSYAYSIYDTGVSERTQIDKYNKIKRTICDKYSFVEPFEWDGDNTPMAVSWSTEKWSIVLVISWYNSAWKNIDLVYTDNEAEKNYLSEIESDY